MNTRLTKVIRDLTSDYRKNLMMVLAIALGVFGIGAMLGGYSVIKREMTDNYLGTRPASATIETDKALTPGIIDSVRVLPGIQVAERHGTVSARMRIDNKWYPMLLFVVDDFKNKQTNRVYHESGAEAPAIGTMLVERTALVVMHAQVGDTITVKTKTGQPNNIIIAGTVHDPGLAPAWQEESGYGYITMTTLKLLDNTEYFDQLRLIVRDQPFSREHITEQAQQVAAFLENAGYPVHEIQVPSPGKHPHQGQMTTVMTLFIIFSFLVLILGSILVATSVSTLMIKQVCQIGIMKTIGARSMQIAGLYLLMILVLCSGALLIAIPLSRLAAAVFYQEIAVLLNLEIRNNSIPAMVPWIQIASGVIIPLLAAAIPVIRGSRIPVRKALDNFGVSHKWAAANSFIMRLSRMSFMGEIFRLSFRNVFRQRSRLTMTLGLLAAGGAMFMTAMNVSEAWDKNLKRIYIQRLYDLDIRFNQPVQTDSLMMKIKRLPGIKAVESWDFASTAVVQTQAFDVTHTYPDKGHGSFTILAMPLPTQLLMPTLQEGRWLSHPDTNEVLLNQQARGAYRVGETIRLSVGGIPTEWKIIGFTEDVGSAATAYVSRQALANITGLHDSTRMLRIAYHDRSYAASTHMNRQVELLLEKENIGIASAIPVWLLHNAIAAHMKVLVNSLLALAMLMALVGTMGLMSTMSMNILERTREIGMMRAIGATSDKIKKLVMWEGLLIGAISIIIAFALSLLLSDYLGKLIGNMSFRTPLTLTVSLTALGIWIVLIGLGSYVATWYPARRANDITTREALAYE